MGTEFEPGLAKGVMRYLFVILFILSCSILPANAQNQPAPGIEKNTFVPGEKMVFQVYSNLNKLFFHPEYYD